jgi:hypothetical protein
MKLDKPNGQKSKANNADEKCNELSKNQMRKEDYALLVRRKDTS